MCSCFVRKCGKPILKTYSISIYTQTSMLLIYTNHILYYTWYIIYILTIVTNISRDSFDKVYELIFSTGFQTSITIYNASNY